MSRVCWAGVWEEEEGEGTPQHIDAWLRGSSCCPSLRRDAESSWVVAVPAHHFGAAECRRMRMGTLYPYRGKQVFTVRP